MRSTPTIFMVLLLSVVMTTAQEPKTVTPPAKDNVPPAGFTALFDGKNMTGWLEGGQPPVHWTAVDGVLSYDGKGKDLYGVEKFGNFILLVDFKVKSGSNSGVYLRAATQVEINDGDGGPKRGLWNGTTGGLYPEKAPLKHAAKPTGEWNHYEITVAKGLITILLNGEKTIDAYKMNWGKKTTGPIGFQHHGTPVWYKNIYVKKLDD